MSLAQLDYIFPFVVFFYGAVMCAVLEVPQLASLGETRAPTEVWKQMTRHRPLAYFCLFIGGLWSLQNLWWV